jgi:hypothetical protein
MCRAGVAGGFLDAEPGALFGFILYIYFVLQRPFFRPIVEQALE